MSPLLSTSDGWRTSSGSEAPGICAQGLVFLVQVLGDLSIAKNLSSNPVVCS